MHGIGVSTPSAAAVAAATIGFESNVQTPKGGMFTMGAISVMLAAGIPQNGRPAGRTESIEGATPPLHMSAAPAQT